MKVHVTKPVVWGIAICVALSLLLIYGLFNPETTPFPRCMFLSLTGWQCPGCGSQRAIHALLHGNISQAWNFNAALVCSLPLLLLMAFAALNRKRLPKLYSLLNSAAACILWLFIIIAWTLFRNLMN